MDAIRAGDRVRTPGFLVGGVPGGWVVAEVRESMAWPHEGDRGPFLLCREPVGGSASLWFPLAEVVLVSRAA